MSDFPILTISILVPLVGAVALMLLPDKKPATGARSTCRRSSRSASRC